MDEARLERDVREQMQAGKVPGLALAIFDDRRVRYAKGFGVTSLDEGGVPVTPHSVEFYTPAGDGYGLAFVTESYKGLRRVKHGGMIGSYGSLFVLAPERRLGFAALYNLTDLLSLNDLEAHLFDTLLTPPDDAPVPTPVEPDPSRWERYVGAYRNGEQMAHIAIEGTNMSIRVDGELYVRA